MWIHGHRFVLVSTTRAIMSGLTQFSLFFSLLSVGNLAARHQTQKDFGAASHRGACLLEGKIGWNNKRAKGKLGIV